jgi:hypothetical protein
VCRTGVEPFGGVDDVVGVHGEGRRSVPLWPGEAVEPGDEVLRLRTAGSQIVHDAPGVAVVVGFELFGDAAPGGEPTPGPRWWSEHVPQLVRGITDRGGDASGPDVVEGGVEVVECVAEAGPGLRGRCDGLGPGVDASPFLDDACPGRLDRVGCCLTVLFGGRVVPFGGVDGWLVAAPPVPLPRLLEGGTGSGDGDVGLM